MLLTMHLVLTSGELEHSASSETLLLPSIASRSIRVAINSSSCSEQKTLVNERKPWKNNITGNHRSEIFKPLRDQCSQFRQLQIEQMPYSSKLPEHFRWQKHECPNFRENKWIQLRVAIKNLYSGNAISRHFS